MKYFFMRSIFSIILCFLSVVSFSMEKKEDPETLKGILKKRGVVCGEKKKRVSFGDNVQRVCSGWESHAIAELICGKSIDSLVDTGFPNYAIEGASTKLPQAQRYFRHVFTDAGSGGFFPEEVPEETLSAITCLSQRMFGCTLKALKKERAAVEKIVKKINLFLFDQKEKRDFTEDVSIKMWNFFLGKIKRDVSVCYNQEVNQATKNIASQTKEILCHMRAKRGLPAENNYVSFAIVFAKKLNPLMLSKEEEAKIKRKEKAEKKKRRALLEKKRREEEERLKKEEKRIEERRLQREKREYLKSGEILSIAKDETDNKAERRRVEFVEDRDLADEDTFIPFNNNPLDLSVLFKSFKEGFLYLKEKIEEIDCKKVDFVQGDK